MQVMVKYRMERRYRLLLSDAYYFVGSHPAVDCGRCNAGNELK